MIALTDEQRDAIDVRDRQWAQRTADAAWRESPGIRRSSWQMFAMACVNLDRALRLPPLPPIEWPL